MKLTKRYEKIKIHLILFFLERRKKLHDYKKAKCLLKYYFSSRQYFFIQNPNVAMGLVHLFKNEIRSTGVTSKLQGGYKCFSMCKVELYLNQMMFTSTGEGGAPLERK